MADTFVALSLSGATFADGSTLSGTWTAEYDDNGNLVGVINPDLIVTATDGTQTTFTDANAVSGNNSAFQFFSQGNGGGFYNLYLDWNGENPTTLSAGGSTYTSIVDPAGNTTTLSALGTVSNVTNSVTSTIHGAVFSDGSTLSGTWTAIYDASGTLVGVENASFTVTGPQGSTTFTEAGTLPYADSPTSSSFEIHFQSQTDNGGGYQSLYVDWKSQNPSSLYEGTPSLYTSVVNTSASGSDTPIRLVNDGTTGQGSVPTISGLPGTESGSDAAALMPLAAVVVSNSDSDVLSATITLSDDNGLTNANGSLTGTGVAYSGTGTYTVSASTTAQLNSDLQSVTFTPTQGQAASGTEIETRIALAINDSDGSASAYTAVTITATCFLPGTLIATPDGEVVVEHLQAGDLVTVLEHGLPVARPIRWAGSGQMQADRHEHRDACCPVRIRAGAFEDGQPRRDLLVTPEHCVLAEGGLVPVRMLVNGASILVDRSMPDYAFFHLELDRHGILLAEGLPTESYLDTGNRSCFDADVVKPTHPSTTAAPLLTARDQVEPLWRRLRDRAAELGLPVPAMRRTISRDPRLRVALDNGCTVNAHALHDDRHMFRIPRGRSAIGLLSRSAVPAEVVGPFLDDRRRLGVAVDRIMLWQDDRARELPVDRLALAGWHAPEGDRRWTDGNAQLGLPPAESDTILDVRVVAVMDRAVPA